MVTPACSSSLADDLNRALRMESDRLRNRAEQHSFPTAVTMRADDDQISAPLLGLFDDDALGRTHDHFRREAELVALSAFVEFGCGPCKRLFRLGALSRFQLFI